MKLLTLSLVLRTMPKTQQTLLMSHFSPEVVKQLAKIEQETGSDVEKLDWTPFYQAWPELQKILNDCKRQAETQKLSLIVDEQRPMLREYIMVKLGKQKMAAPVFLSPDIIKVVDRFISGIRK